MPRPNGTFWLRKLLFTNMTKMSKCTLWKFGMYGIVVNLHGRVGVGPCESHYMVAAIVNLGQNVADGDVFGAQVVIEKQFSTVLKENKGNYLLSTPFLLALNKEHFCKSINVLSPLVIKIL